MAMLSRIRRTHYRLNICGEATAHNAAGGAVGTLNGKVWGGVLFKVGLTSDSAGSVNDKCGQLAFSVLSTAGPCRGSAGRRLSAAGIGCCNEWILNKVISHIRVGFGWSGPFVQWLY